MPEVKSYLASPRDDEEVRFLRNAMEHLRQINDQLREHADAMVGRISAINEGAYSGVGELAFLEVAVGKTPKRSDIWPYMRVLEGRLDEIQRAYEETYAQVNPVPVWPHYVVDTQTKHLGMPDDVYLVRTCHPDSPEMRIFVQFTYGEGPLANSMELGEDFMRKVEYALKTSTMFSHLRSAPKLRAVVEQRMHEALI